MKKNYHNRRPRPLNHGSAIRSKWQYRQALRQCRKNKKRYGVAFDDTEVTELAVAMCTFMQSNSFPIDKVLLYHGRYIINKHVREAYPELNLPDINNEVFEAIEKLEADLCKQISQLPDAYKQRLVDFLLPRLQCFADTCTVYPDFLEEEKPENLEIIVAQMIDELKNNKLDTVIMHRRILIYEWYMFR